MHKMQENSIFSAHSTLLNDAQEHRRRKNHFPVNSVRSVDKYIKINPINNYETGNDFLYYRRFFCNRNITVFCRRIHSAVREGNQADNPFVPDNNILFSRNFP